MRKKTTEQYKQEVKIKCENKVCVLEEYNGKIPILHKCNICGYEFKVAPDNFLHKWKTFCPNCKETKKNPNKGRKFKTHTFQDVANISCKIHGDKYVYPEQEYSQLHNKARIICPKHGEFIKTWTNHIFNKQGCPKCLKEEKIELERQKFLKAASDLFKTKYDYSEVEYLNSSTPVKIKCNECGNVFYMAPNNHICQRQGCPECSSSKGEKQIEDFLNRYNIKYVHDKPVFDWLVNDDKMRPDFYLPDYNICIEYNGIQHYKPVEFFGGENGLKDTQRRDGLKRKLLVEHGIELLEISYLEFESIDKILTKFLKSYIIKLNKIKVFYEKKDY